MNASIFIPLQSLNGVFNQVDQHLLNHLFVHLYLNGVYWGQYQLMERPNAAFMASNFGGDPSDYDALNAGSPIDGDDGAWKALLDGVDDGY